MKNNFNLIKETFILICLILGFSFPATAANIDETLHKLQENYTNLSGFEAQITQELFHRESNSTEKRQGKIVFSKPDNILLETTNPSPEFIIVNAKEIWHYLPDEEVAYRYNVAALENSQIALSILTGQNKISDDFEVEEFKGDDINLIGLLLYPNEPSTNLVEAQIWINPKAYLIEKLTVLDFFGNTNSIVFENFKPNPKIDPEIFEFSPPENIDVEDRYNEQ